MSTGPKVRKWYEAFSFISALVTLVTELLGRKASEESETSNNK